MSHRRSIKSLAFGSLMIVGVYGCGGIHPSGRPAGASADAKAKINAGQTAGSASSNELPPLTNAEAKLYINGWDGSIDQPSTDSKWTITTLTDAQALASAHAKGGSSNQGTGGGSGGSSGGGTGGNSQSSGSNSGSGSGGGSSTNLVGYDQVAPILNAKCTFCHNPNGSQAGSPLDTYDNAKSLGAGIIQRIANGSMPTSGTKVTAAELQTIKAWQAAGYPQSSSQAGSGGSNAGQSNTVTLEITDQRYGNYLNATPIVAKVGQTLHIVNHRSSGTFILHTNGSPCPHGDVSNPLQPGDSVDYLLTSTYTGTDGVYEHTDGSVNLDRLINIRVTN